MSSRIFREHPDVLALYHERFRFILVDEYQDTNVAQYLWLRLLAQGRRNVCCVGDDDQSIYGWRGAEVDNILRFEHDFPGAKVIRLEQNYRSTGHILGAASGLIAHNQGRLGKTLRTEAEDGAMVTVTGAWDSQEEARLIGDEIEALQSKGHSLSEMAVLVRISAQMREIEDRFVNLGLPYRVIGGPRFYERMEIRDALAYFRIVTQPADDLAFERIINTPKRGLAEGDALGPAQPCACGAPAALAGGRGAGAIGGAEAEAPRLACATSSSPSRAGRSGSKAARRIPRSRRRSSRNSATPTCGRPIARPTPRAVSTTSRSSSARWRSFPTCAPSSSMSRSSWRRAKARMRSASRS